MNEKVEATPAKGLEEAPAAFRSPAPIEQPERPIWRLEELRGADLRGQDLTTIEGLLPEHLAGADLTGAKLRDDIAKFEALGQVGAISSEARKIFIGLLAACVYSWLVIGTTTDVALIVNTASSPLPIINTPIPIAGFYVIGATLLAAVYGYFHFYLQRLWRTLATLPAFFRDGTALDDRTDPWLLTNLVRADFKQLARSPPPLTRLESLLAIFLAWWLVPLTLLALWARYLPAHYWLGTTWLVVLIGVTALFGRHSYRLARATLRGETPAAAAEGDDDQGVSRRAWHEFRQIRPDRLTVGVIAVLIVCSLSAFRDNPRDPYTWVAKGLNAVGIRTYADLREVAVAVRPDGWDGKDWSKVKRIDLRGRNLAFADATGAFLANSDLRSAALTDADLSYAQLQGAILWEAQLQGAGLTGAQLQGADLGETTMWRAQVEGAQWDLADLRGSTVQPIAASDIDALITEATNNIPDEVGVRGLRLNQGRKAVAERLNAALRTTALPAWPNFPEEWRSEPNVMFDPKGPDPEPQPFKWGPHKWPTEQAYDEDLAKLLGDLACGRDVPEAQTRGLAWRALRDDNKDRLFASRLAARLISADCPPAKGLPDDMRRKLEQLAARSSAAAPAAPETSAPDPVE